jgi:hypothetical protein
MSKLRKSQTPSEALAVVPSNGTPQSTGQKVSSPMPALDLAAIEKAKERIEAAQAKVDAAEDALDAERVKLQELLGPLEAINRLARGR